MILATLLLIAAVITGVLLLVGGAGFLVVFGDFIVFGLILYWILRRIFR